VFNGHTRTIPLMVVLASTAIFATIAVARYVSKQDKSASEQISAHGTMTDDKDGVR